MTDEERAVRACVGSFYPNMHDVKVCPVCANILRELREVRVEERNRRPPRDGFGPATAVPQAVVA